MTETLRRSLGLYLSRHWTTFLFGLACFAIGIASGASGVEGLAADQRSLLVGYLDAFLQGLVSGELDASPGLLLLNAWLRHLKSLLLIGLLGLSAFGIPLVLAVLFVQGFVLGFSVGFLIYQSGWSGLLFASAAVLPQNLLAVPALLVLGASSLTLSLHVWRQRGAGRSWRALVPELSGYGMICGVTAILWFGAGLVEAYVSPSLMRLLSPYL